MVGTMSREMGSRNDLPIDLTSDGDIASHAANLPGDGPRPRPKEQRTREKPSWLSQEGIQIVTLDDDDHPPSPNLPQEKSKPWEPVSLPKVDIELQPDTASLPLASLIGEGSRTTSSTRERDDTTIIVREANHRDNCENESGPSTTTSDRSNPMDPKRTGPIVPQFGPLASHAKGTKHEQTARPVLSQAIRKSAPSIRGPMVGGMAPFRPLTSSSRTQHRTTNRTEADQIRARVESLRKPSPVKIATPEPPANLTQQDAEAGERRAMPAPERVAERHDSTDVTHQTVTASADNSQHRLMPEESVEDCLLKHLGNLHRSHACDVKYSLRRQRTRLDRAVKAQKNPGNKTSLHVPTIMSRKRDTTDPFADMEPLQAPAGRAKSMTMVQEILLGARTGIKKTLTAPITSYKSRAADVPGFHEYVQLRDSVLTENNRKLPAIPYLAEGQHEDPEKRDLWKKLNEHYEIFENEDRALMNNRAEQTRIHRYYVQDFLEEVGITFNDVLYWILAPEADLQRIAGSDSLVNDREPYHDQSFIRERQNWSPLFEHLSKPSIGVLRLSALACKMFSAHRDFSLWHIARQSEVAQKHILSIIEHSEEVSPDAAFSFRTNSCRVCHEWNCPFHGEIRERPETDSEEEAGTSRQSLSRASSFLDEYSETDESAHESPTLQISQEIARALNETPQISDTTSDSESSDSSLAPDVEEIINYKRPINVLKPANRILSQNVPQQTTRPKFDLNYWKRSNTLRLDERRPFYPCSHEGSCEQAQCRCFVERILCEKTCSCPASCERRYPGCDCRRDPRNIVCGMKSKCPCRELNRECDADLCGGCGATEVLDPNNRYDDRVLKDGCSNVGIQRNVPIKTLLGNSELHGFGLYTGEDIRADQYIGEYKGEILTNEEGDRRLILYEHSKTNYLFKLCRGQEVDSTRAGNKLRFINHANKAHANCYPRVLLCNTVVRIGLFAKYDLKAGIELFFDYGYPAHVTAQFAQPKTKTYGTVKAVKVKALAYKSKSKLPMAVKRGKAKNKKVLSTPERQMQTVNARAAKALKRAQRTASSSSSAQQPSSKMARKSITSDNIYTNGRPAANQPSARSTNDMRSKFPDLVELFNTDDENSVEEDEDKNENEDGVSEDDESEDDESEDDESDTGNEYSVPDTESEQEASAEEESDRAARGSRLRNSLDGVAMRQRNKRAAALQPSSSARAGRHGGRREGAGRKRKRHSDG